MTPKERAAMQQALEALGCYNSKHRHTYGLDGAWDEEITKGEKAITAMRKALAEHPVTCSYPYCTCINGTLCRAKNTIAEQAEQEPVALIVLANGLQYGVEFLDQVALGTKLYAAPVSIEAAAIRERSANARARGEK